MDEDMQTFFNSLSVADKNNNYIDIYMFIKDCAFKRIQTITNQRAYPQNITGQLFDLYNKFQGEIQMYNWNFYSMKQDRYGNFLNYLYKQYNFAQCSIVDLLTLKALTENLQLLGSIDNLSRDRSKLIFFISLSCLFPK